MRWKNISDILKEFHIDRSPYDLDGIHRALTKLLSETHPDKTGGAFASDEQRQRYESISEAIEFLRRGVAQLPAVVPVDQIAEIVRAIAGGLQPAQSPPPPSPSRKFPKVPVPFRSLLTGRHAIPAIGSALIWALCAFLLTLPGILKQNPYYLALRSEFASKALCSVVHQHISEWHLGEDIKDLTRDGIDGIEGLDLSSYECETSIGSEEALAKLALSLSTIIESISKVLPEVEASWKQVEVDPGKVDVSKQTRSDDEIAFQRNIYKARNTLRTVLSAAKDLTEYLKSAPQRIEGQIDREVSVLLGYVFLIASFAFGYFWLRERSDERWMASLEGDQGLADVFARMKELSRSNPNSGEFSVAEFRAVAEKKTIPLPMRLLLGSRVNLSDDAITAMLTKLEGRHVIAAADKTDVQGWYKIS